MSAVIEVTGGASLRGEVGVHGAKNAVLKEMVATLMAPGRHVLENVPGILDVDLMAEVLRHVGCVVERADHVLTIVVPDELVPEAPLDLVRKMRASIIVLGPLLARTGRARVAFPGGDDLGARPIDMHMKALERMGAEFTLEHGVLVGSVPGGRLAGADVHLRFPSVGATENAILAAVLAEGPTTVHNPAREPEILDLCEHLSAMGASIRGAGTAELVIEGVGSLEPTRHRVVPDRLEAGTFAVAAAITGGEVTVVDCHPDHLRMELAKLEATGCEVERGEGRFTVVGPERPHPTDIATLPYPGFHTDMQSQFVALLSVADGTSMITENLFDNRFAYVGELARMGADITVDWQHATVRGVRRLSGCPVMANDIRAGAALVLAGLAADGVTTVSEVHHVDRGYERLDERLASLGGMVRRTDA